MKRKILVLALALGTLGGYGWGFASLARHRRAWRAHAERRVEQVCERGARRALGRGAGRPDLAGPEGLQHP